MFPEIVLYVYLKIGSRTINILYEELDDYSEIALIYICCTTKLIVFTLSFLNSIPFLTVLKKVFNKSTNYVKIDNT